MTRTLVTGAAGFTGQYVGKLLASQGHELHALVHGNCGAPIVSYDHVHEADLRDSEAVGKIIRTVEPECVVHLAAIAFVGHEDIAEIYSVNVIGTRNLLEELSCAKNKPRAILLPSSANVYGNVGGELSETSPFAPANDYAVTKVATEYVASIYRDSLPLIVVRPFNYTGRGQSLRFLIPKIVHHVRTGATEIELGNVDIARDFSDVRTVADAYGRLLSSQSAIGGTYNVCSGRSVTLRQVLNLLAEESGHQLTVRVNPALVRTNEVRSLHGSARKIEHLVGPLRHFSLEETLQWMLHD